MLTAEKNVKLNLLKGFACIAVVFIHVSFPGLFGEITATASGFAVPVFFMISGNFAFGCSEQVIKRRLFKVIRIFLLSYCLFFLYGIFKSILSGTPVTSWLMENFNRHTLIDYLVFCTIDFAMPLWYLIAMIEVYLLWLLIIRTGTEQLSLKIMPLLFILLIVSTMFSWSWRVNFLTQGMSWFLLGYYCNTDMYGKISTVSRSTLIVSAFIGCVAVVLPAVLRSTVKFGMLGIIPFAFSLFALALKDPNVSICRPLEFIGEKLSLYIYLLHVPVRGVIIFLFGRVFRSNIYSKIFLWTKPLMVLLSTILISMAIYASSKRLQRKN